MWWHEGGSAGRGECDGAHAPCAPSQPRLLRAIAALAIAALTGGCFQPLYGEQSPTGGPVLRDQLSAVDILQIAAPREPMRRGSRSKSATRSSTTSPGAAMQRHQPIG